MPTLAERLVGLLAQKNAAEKQAALAQSAEEKRKNEELGRLLELNKKAVGLIQPEQILDEVNASLLKGRGKVVRDEGLFVHPHCESDGYEGYYEYSYAHAVSSVSLLWKTPGLYYRLMICVDSGRAGESGDGSRDKGQHVVICCSFVGEEGPGIRSYVRRAYYEDDESFNSFPAFSESHCPGAGNLFSPDKTLFLEGGPHYGSSKIYAPIDITDIEKEGGPGAARVKVENGIVSVVGKLREKKTAREIFETQVIQGLSPAKPRSGLLGRFFGKK